MLLQLLIAETSTGLHSPQNRSSAPDFTVIPILPALPVQPPLWHPHAAATSAKPCCHVRDLAASSGVPGSVTFQYYRLPSAAGCGGGHLWAGCTALGLGCSYSQGSLS